MNVASVLLSLTLPGSTWAQQAGTVVPEVHPSFTWQKCTKSGGCITQSYGKIVLDSDWRWLHSVSDYTNCFTRNAWNPSLCPDPVTCATNCALEGADYSATYGITTSGNALTLKFSTSSGSASTIGSRVYLLANDTTYQTFKLKNQEFTFDVDASNLPCEINGALFFSQMDADGGMAKFPRNKAGAKYGTGFCNAQCPKDVKFINGEANLLDWTASPIPKSPDGGTGLYGSCCTEMDVWEANTISTAYTPHSCSLSGQTRCSGADCSSGYCDPDGCDFNPYRMGDKKFYGKGMTIDSTQKITVVTQFITSDGTAAGSLSEIRRLYVQNGKVIQNSKTNTRGMPVYDSIMEPYCKDQKAAFGEANTFAAKGGFGSMEKAFENGMVLAMSIWNDPTTKMLWLDGNYPVDADPSQPGISRGTCPTDSVQLPVEGLYPTPSVTFSNIRFGDIGSTYNASSPSTIASLAI